MIYLMRGLPGSGKTTWLNNLRRSTAIRVLSADDHFMVDGVYHYDIKDVAVAHGKCLKAYTLAIVSHEALRFDLAVDNTNTSLVELAPYVRLAEAFGYDLKIVYVTCDVATAIQCNTHGVPPNAILAMQRNLLTEIVPASWRQEVIPRQSTLTPGVAHESRRPGDLPQVP